MNKILATLTGASCSGKTTVLEELLKRHPETYARVWSYTTRKPRAGDIIDGSGEYKFISDEEFDDRLRNGEFIQFVFINGSRYGTTKRGLMDILDGEKIPLRIVEPTGVQQFREACLPLGLTVVPIFFHAEPGDLLSRWGDRMNKEVNPDIASFAKRIRSTLEVECFWHEAEKYDCWVNTGTSLSTSETNSVDKTHRYLRDARGDFNQEEKAWKWPFLPN